ncbi:MAG: ATP-binding protein [Acidobacteriota bacterium]
MASLVGCLGVIFALFGYQLTEQHRRDLEAVNFEAADRISDSIKRSILYSMQLNHREHIYHTIKTLGGEPGINKIRIFNEVGRISYSSDDAEINTLVDKKEEACYACHNQEEPLSRLPRPDRRRIYFDPQGNRILGLINAIENEPRCYEASCHAHSPDQRVLGVLDVTMSLASIDETIRKGRSVLLAELALSVLVVSIVLGVVVWFLVHRPIRQLMTGTEKLAAGDLDFRIQVDSRDEMGALGRSFNRMTEQLKQAHSELTAWAQTLESRVEEKTAALRDAHRHMIQVERMASMGKLAAIVAHEINNPLAGILTSARLVLKRLSRQGVPEDDTTEQLELIAQEAGRCGDIVKSLLQFARPRSEVRQPEDLNALVRDALRLVQHKMNLMSVETQFNLAEGVPPVICDSQGIKQVLVAVLINATEAVGSAGGQIVLGTCFLADQGLVEVSVRDNGCGMDEQTRQRIFEPFFTTKEDAHGVGLGMAVVSGIVAAHGGEIRIDSAVGLGTTVTIVLPASSSAEVA